MFAKAKDSNKSITSLSSNGAENAYSIACLDTQYCYLFFNNIHSESVHQTWGTEISFGLSLLASISDSDERLIIQGKLDRAISGDIFTEISESSGHQGIVWETIYSPMYNADGVVTGINVTSSNVTKQVNAKEAVIARDRKYQYIFDNMIEGLALCEIICDDKGIAFDYRVLEVNKAYEQQTGIKAKDIVGKTVLEFYPDIEKYWIEIYAEVALSRKFHTFTNFNHNTDKHYVTSTFPLTNGQFALLFRDISESKKIEKALSDSEENLRKAQEVAHLASWEWNVSNGDVKWSDEQYRMLGLDLGEISPSYEYYLNAINREDRAYTLQMVEKALAGEGEYDLEYRIIRKDGEERIVHTRATVERDADGNLLRIIGTAQDITERKHREEEKIRLHRELSQSHKMEALGKLTGEVAHEYNNMLAIMLGFSQLLQESFVDNPKVFKYAGEIQLAGNRAAKLTNKLLTFSQGKTQVAQSINLNNLLQQQHHMLEKTLTVSIDLVYELQENLWLVWIDGSDMEDAILNMCINAMYAMNDCGQLTIETHNKNINSSDAASLNIIAGDYVLFSITDTGCGISKENKGKIFDPFFTTKGYSGTGLGLSIVYGFVQNSGGIISVNSVEGEGTKFTLYFPRYNGAHSKNKIVIETPPKDTLLKNKTILIVDDEPALVKLTQEILTAQGFIIFSAGDATQALRILEHESIDLMICDVILPGINGFQLAVIAKDEYPDIKIQLISGFAGDRNKNMATKDLQENMLRKPFNSKDLLKKMHTLLHENK